MIQEELQQLEKITGQVRTKLQKLEEENGKLRDDLEGLRKSMTEREQELKDFKNQIKITKLVNSIPVANIESAELREKINNYIQEIDNIIAYLSE